MRTVMLFMILLFELIFGFSNAQLQVGFYNEVCPEAESIVTGFVKDAANSNPQIPAIMLRLHFHDCFVEVLSFSLSLSIYNMNWTMFFFS